ncbi:MAG: baseplate J/gp47 family protein [Clostridia bacterium]|nr:baseplate J/gp47 family protein [Clostridia bacterium]
MRGMDYDFVSTDAKEIESEMIASFEAQTGRALLPGDPERLLLAWFADAVARERVKLNFAGNMNLPSSAAGEYLDALGEWIYGVKRNPAAAAKCTVRFTITPATTAVLIPAGTRVTDTAQSLTWATTADALIPIGESSIDVMVECQTAGEVGNGYAAGQISTLVDPDNVQFFVACANTDESDGGSETEDDDAYFARMRASLDGASAAGSEGGYIYRAKSASAEIADVKAVRPMVWVEELLPTIVDSENGIEGIILGKEGVDLSTVTVNGSPATSGSPGVSASTVFYYASAGETNTVRYRKELPGLVYLYAVTQDGQPVGSVLKTAILTACSARDARPLTDRVEVHDPEVVSYNVNLTYYLPRNSGTPAAEITAAVEKAVQEYIDWQHGKLGRDVNPSKLWQLLMATGIKRAVITAPTFTALSDGSDGSAPEIAAVGTVTITNGGYEDE